MNKTQKQIISELRKNSREKISEIARKLGFASTTANDKYLDAKKYIKKCTSLIDFAKLGYSFRMNFIFRIKNKKILKTIQDHKNINSIQLINNRNTLMVWGIFKSLAQAYEFKEMLEDKGISNIRLSHVIEDIQIEKMQI